MGTLKEHRTTDEWMHIVSSRNAGVARDVKMLWTVEQSWPWGEMQGSHFSGLSRRLSDLNTPPAARHRTADGLSPATLHRYCGVPHRCIEHLLV